MRFIDEARVRAQGKAFFLELRYFPKLQFVLSIGGFRRAYLRIYVCIGALPICRCGSIKKRNATAAATTFNKIVAEK